MYAVYTQRGDIHCVLRPTMAEGEQDAVRSSSRQPLEVWWLNDCSVRKLRLATVQAGVLTRTADGVAVAVHP